MGKFQEKAYMMRDNDLRKKVSKRCAVGNIERRFRIVIVCRNVRQSNYSFHKKYDRKVIVLYV